MDELSLDQDFLTRFSCMGTQDKDVLISQLHVLLDSQLSREGCTFFLEMTNWNLQAAVGAFYDHYSAEGGVLPDIALVARVMEQGTVNEDQSVTLASNTSGSLTWTLRNIGSVVWPLGVRLVAKGNHHDLSSVDHVHLPCLSPGQETSVSIEVRAPSAPGLYLCQWRAALPGGALFGDPIWLKVRVQEDELMSGLVQQLSSFSTGDRDMDTTSGQCLTEDRALRHVGEVHNPFGSPTVGAQDQPYVSSSMMGDPLPNTSTTSIDQLLLHPSSPTQFSPRPIFHSIADSPSPLLPSPHLQPLLATPTGPSPPVHTDSPSQVVTPSTSMEDGHS